MSRFSQAIPWLSLLLIISCTITYKSKKTIKMKKSTKDTTRVVSKVTFKLLPKHCWTSDLPSATIPGETYTITELMAKQAHGLLPQFSVAYEDQDANIDDDISHRRPLDLTDLQATADKSQYTIDQAIAEKKQSDKDAKQKELKKSALKEAKNELNEQLKKEQETEDEKG